MNSIYSQQQFLTYFAKGSLYYSGSEFEGAADCQLRIIKDSIACLIIKKLGIELFRILIERDSVTVLDRIENTWQKNSIIQWTSQLKLPVDFYLIQDVLTSGFYLSEYLSYEWKQSPDTSLLMGTSELFQFNTQILLQPLRSSSINFNSLGQFTTIDILKHESINGNLLPKSFEFRFRNERNEIKFIHIESKEIKLNSKETIKFEIPTHYKRG
ncbi:MAG: DUF4292 domain-containing protein [Saprospiraceae bacterium]|nr:DUF4292 domain-containing protein [Saprospiraceae bacterium]